MATQYQLTISRAFRGLEPDNFQREIGASAVAPALTSWSVDGDTLTLDFDADITAGDIEQIGALATLHGLRVAKQCKVAEIDQRTRQLIAAGFSHGGSVFSLSMEAQSRLSCLLQVRADLSYPVRWNTIDDLGAIEFANATELEAFCLAGIAAIRSCVDSGTALKDDNRAALTLTAVDAVDDTR